MPTTPSGGPLLLNGEALRIPVTQVKPAGGDKYDPQELVDAQRSLSPLAQQAVEQASSLPSELRAERLYLELRLLPNYISASSFPSDLLTQIGAVSVGSRADTGVYKTRTREPKKVGTRRLLVSVDDAGLAKLDTLIRKGGSSKVEQQALENDLIKFDDLTLSSAPKRLVESSSDRWEAVLHPEPGVGRAEAAASEAVMLKWMHLIESLGGKVNPDYTRRIGGLTFTSVRLPHTAAEDALRFNPLRVMRPMPHIRPLPGIQLREGEVVQEPATQMPRSDKFRVAIFDGGLGASTALFPDGAIDLTSEPAVPGAVQHGTAVMGAATFGLARPGEVLSAPPLPIDSYRVFPPPLSDDDPEGYWILDRIRDIVEEGRHKIVNLSLGPAEAVVDDQEPNLWTSTLDQLAWEHDVLFVVAAGNHGDQDSETGLDRIEAPADMANGISVGATDKAAPAPQWARAPYSSKGPGRQGNRTQPTGLQFGGTAANPYPTMRADGSLGASWGTSFAAPLVTHAVADLAAQLPEAHPNVLRAFVTHFAERHTEHKKRRNEVGYGRISNTFDGALTTSANEANVLYVDSIPRDELLGFQIPVPARFAGPVQMRITLAFASSVDPTEPTDYTRGTLDLSLRPHAHMFTFRPPKGTIAANATLDQRSQEAVELIDAGWKQGGAPLTKGLGAGAFIPEHQLRDEGKWETLRHARINFKAGECRDPWVEVSYVARRAGSIDAGPSEMPFALIVSLNDSSKSGVLYQQITEQFQALRPLTSIRSRVRV